MMISNNSGDDRKFTDRATQSRRRCTRTVFKSGNSIGNCASLKEGSTLKVINLTQLQAGPKKLYKIVPKLFEQTTYSAHLSLSTHEMSS
jgi:hypothetical protein